MKQNIHPKYNEVKVTCSCGNSFMTRSTLGSSDLSIDKNIDNIEKNKEFWKVLVLVSLLFITIEILLIKTIKT